MPAMTPSSSDTSRSRKRWNGRYHSRSQWVWGTTTISGAPARPALTGTVLSPRPRGSPCRGYVPRRTSHGNRAAEKAGENRRGTRPVRDGRSGVHQLGGAGRERLHRLRGHRPRRRREDRVVHREDRLHVPRRGRQERLVGPIQVLQGEVLLLAAEPLQHHRARHPGQAAGRQRWRDEAPAQDDEDVAARLLTEVPGEVAEDRLAAAALLGVAEG